MGIVTYPHQRVVNVRREPINADFLGISLKQNNCSHKQKKSIANKPSKRRQKESGGSG